VGPALAPWARMDRDGWFKLKGSSAGRRVWPTVVADLQTSKLTPCQALHLRYLEARRALRVG
jgi:hypothetical protein